MARDVEFGQLYPVVALVCDVLDRLRIPYLIGGSVAARLHGYTQRNTHDVDLLADIQRRHAAKLAAALAPAFVNADASEIHAALDLVERFREPAFAARNRPSLNITYRQVPTIHADVFLPVGERFEREQFKRRVRVRGPDGRGIWIASIEICSSPKPAGSRSARAHPISSGAISRCCWGCIATRSMWATWATGRKILALPTSGMRSGAVSGHFRPTTRRSNSACSSHARPGWRPTPAV